MQVQAVIETPPGDGVMRLEDSMCQVIEKAKQGDDDAVRVIWDRFFPRVVRLAGQRLEGQRRQATDQEDVGISVMESFFRAASSDRFPDLKDSDGLWRLLSTMTRRKVIDAVRRSAARPVVGESALHGEATIESAQRNHPLAALAASDPTPAMIALINDQFEQLLAVLPEKYRPVALHKLACMTAAEIAAECGVHISTVERRLKIIRKIWQQEFEKP